VITQPFAKHRCADQSRCSGVVKSVEHFADRLLFGAVDLTLTDPIETLVRSLVL